MKVPFVNLKLSHAPIRQELDEAIKRVVDSAQFIGGEEVEVFEENFAKLHEAKYCIGTSSGTDALHLALWGLGIGRRDEVIVPVNTFIATAEAVCLTGAKPVFVDVKETHFNIDVERVAEAITSDTKAIIPVHLYGQPADMWEIARLAVKEGIWIVEDACQAHTVTYMDQLVGTFGMAGCFSFYPSKNLGCFGEGGAVITNYPDLYQNMRMGHNHGRSLEGGGKHGAL